ncbi:hypothetical protein D9M73_189450 [compost metagenome]
MAVDAALVTGVGGHAQGIEQLFAAEDALGLFQQALQQAEFMAGKGQQLTAITDLHTVAIDAKQRRRRFAHRAGRHALENRPDPRRHFPRTERLDHVIVGADFQAHDAIDLAIPGTEEHHRHFAEAPQLLAGFEAADVRQADIENDQIRRGLALVLQRRRAQAQPCGGEALALQGENQGIGNGRFVFDNQDMRHGVRARQ